MSDEPVENSIPHERILIKHLEGAGRHVYAASMLVYATTGVKRGWLYRWRLFQANKHVVKLLQYEIKKSDTGTAKDGA